MIEPTGYTALDLIGFTDRGTYAANVNYVKNDLVHYGGNIWKILIDDTIGITPAEGPNYTIFMGEPSNIVERIIAPLEDNPATVAYQTGRQIIYNDYLYEVIDDIAVGDTLITYEDDPTNANIKLSSPVETQVLALDTRLTASEGQIDNLINDEYSQVIVMGDSYMDGWDGSQYVSNVPALLIIDRLHKVLNETGYRWTQGGMGFLGIGGTSVDQYIENHHSEITDPENIKAVIIGVGYNDAKNMTAELSGSQLQTKMLAALNKIKLYFPNASVYLANCTAGYTDLSFDKRLLTASGYSLHSKTLGINFIGNAGNVLKLGNNYQLISSDGIHPTNYGMSYLAGAILDGMFGKIDIYSNSLSDGEIKLYIANNELKLVHNGLTFITSGLASSVECNGETPIYTDTFNTSYGRTGQLIGRTNANVLIRTGSTAYEVCPCNIMIYGNKVTVCPILLNDTKNGFKTVTPRSIVLYPFNASFDLTTAF